MVIGEGLLLEMERKEHFKHNFSRFSVDFCIFLKVYMEFGHMSLEPSMMIPVYNFILRQHCFIKNHTASRN